MAVDPRDYSDNREVPKYTIGDAAWYLDIPPSTLRWWCLGRHFRIGDQKRFSERLIAPALYDPRNPSLSFYNLAEAHVLAATRRIRGISMRNIRDAIDYLASVNPSPHQLIGREFCTDGKELFIKNITETVNLSKKGQTVFKEIVDKHLDRLDLDDAGWPTKIYPIRHMDVGKRPVVIIPTIGGGQPVTPRKGIRVSVLLNRKWAGESIRQIAEDYGLTEREVEEATRYMEAA